ncbi:MAG: hypothetical protein KDI34_12380 [Halioglobus sp.]|nr:hypothetical protein [Halioglobus sp.]
MGSLQTRHLQDVLEISHRALACETMDELQQEALTSMESVIGASSSVYSHITETERTFQFREGKQRGVPPDAMARWCDSYHRQDPFIHRYLACLSTSPCNVVVSGEVIPHREYVASRFYNEFLKPQAIYHVMIIGLNPARGSPFGVFGLHRSPREKAFSATEVATANMLAPCLKGAVERITARETVAAGVALSSKRVPESESGDGLLLHQRLAEFGLSRRERDVVSLLYKGLTSLSIAEQLHISVRTVNNHLRTIFEKAGVHNRTSLIYQLSH